MARGKLISDEAVLDRVLDLLKTGEKSVTFAAVSAATGLAPPTLVQRYGSCPAMIAMALRSAWDRLDASAQTASNMQTNGKGAQGLLKALSGPIDIPTVLTASLPDETLAARAKAWRHLVEKALAARLGDGAKAQKSAAILFATWQGRLLWDAAGGKGFRLGEALKRLT
jgi:hypothetical protein